MVQFKERVFSFRNKNHSWNPKKQRPELWNIYNTHVSDGETIRVFPLSNWTEKDIWQYIKREKIEVVPLYFAKERNVININNNLTMIDDDRILNYIDSSEIIRKKVRFRTLGCYPLTGAIESTATTIDDVVRETLSAVSSERTSRVIDHENGTNIKKRNKEGYF